MKYILTTLAAMPYLMFATDDAMVADAETESAETETESAEIETESAETGGRSLFTKEQIAEIRALRAEVHPEGHAKAGKPVWSHAALAEKFGTKAGTISQIVRNRTHKDPNYTPVNDGK